MDIDQDTAQKHVWLRPVLLAFVLFLSFSGLFFMSACTILPSTQLRQSGKPVLEKNQPPEEGYVRRCNPVAREQVARFQPLSAQIDALECNKAALHRLVRVQGLRIKPNNLRFIVVGPDATVSDGPKTINIAWMDKYRGAHLSLDFPDDSGFVMTENTCPHILKPRSSCSVSVDFSSNATTQIITDLGIAVTRSPMDGSPDIRESARLIGDGFGWPYGYFQMRDFDRPDDLPLIRLDSGPQTSKSIDIVLESVGNAPAVYGPEVINLDPVSDDSWHLDPDSDCFQRAVEPGDSCLVTVIYRPMLDGQSTARLNLPRIPPDTNGRPCRVCAWRTYRLDLHADSFLHGWVVPKAVQRTGARCPVSDAAGEFLMTWDIDETIDNKHNIRTISCPAWEHDSLGRLVCRRDYRTPAGTYNYYEASGATGPWHHVQAITPNTMPYMLCDEGRISWVYELPLLKR